MESESYMLQNFGNIDEGGVYIIYTPSEMDEEILFIGYSFNNLSKSLYRHFQNWSKPNKTLPKYYTNRTKDGYNYLNLTGRLIIPDNQSPNYIEEIAKSLIIKYKPQYNKIYNYCLGVDYGCSSNILTQKQKNILEKIDKTPVTTFNKRNYERSYPD